MCVYSLFEAWLSLPDILFSTFVISSFYKAQSTAYNEFLDFLGSRITLDGWREYAGNMSASIKLSIVFHALQVKQKNRIMPIGKDSK